MSLPEDSVLAGASQRAMGSKAKGRVRHGGVGTAKAAKADCRGVGDEGRANYLRGAPRALGIAQRCAGAPEESTVGTEGALAGCHSNRISDG